MESNIIKEMCWLLLIFFSALKNLFDCHVIVELNWALGMNIRLRIKKPRTECKNCAIFYSDVHSISNSNRNVRQSSVIESVNKKPTTSETIICINESIVSIDDHFIQISQSDRFFCCRNSFGRIIAIAYSLYPALLPIEVKFERVRIEKSYAVQIFWIILIIFTRRRFPCSVRVCCCCRCVDCIFCS